MLKFSKINSALNLLFANIPPTFAAAIKIKSGLFFSISIFLLFTSLFILSVIIGWMYFLIITFFSSLMLAGYHFGIENDLFPEFSGCTTDNLNLVDKEKLLESLSQIIPNCKDVTFKLFGLSLATINLFISLLILIISIILIKNEKNR